MSLSVAQTHPSATGSPADHASKLNLPTACLSGTIRVRVQVPPYWFPGLLDVAPVAAAVVRDGLSAIGRPGSETRVRPLHVARDVRRGGLGDHDTAPTGRFQCSNGEGHCRRCATRAHVRAHVHASREHYEQELIVETGGEYWIAAYARDEDGQVIQSSPHVVFLPMPPSFNAHGSHGAPPSYAGDDQDFLRPAGKPHYASLHSATLTQRGVRVVDEPLFPHLSERVVAEERIISLEGAFQRARFPRPGLYALLCRGVAVFRLDGALRSTFSQCQSDLSLQGTFQR